MNDAHLTPDLSLGDMPMPAHWKLANSAFICYTPFPKGFQQYLVEVSNQRYFLHSLAMREHRRNIL